MSVKVMRIASGEEEEEEELDRAKSAAELGARGGNARPKKLYREQRASVVPAIP